MSKCVLPKLSLLSRILAHTNFTLPLACRRNVSRQFFPMIIFAQQKKFETQSKKEKKNRQP